MRTAEHMEHRNLERKWRPSFALGPHLTEGRSNDERRRLLTVRFESCCRASARSLPFRLSSPMYGCRAASLPAMPQIQRKRDNVYVVREGRLPAYGTETNRAPMKRIPAECECESCAQLAPLSLLVRGLRFRANIPPPATTSNDLTLPFLLFFALRRAT